MLPGLLTALAAALSGGAIARLFEWKKQQLHSGDTALQVLSTTVDKLQKDFDLRIAHAEASAADCEKRYRALTLDFDRLRKATVESTSAAAALQQKIYHQEQDIATLVTETTALRTSAQNLRRKLEIEDTGSFPIPVDKPFRRSTKPPKGRR